MAQSMTGFGSAEREGCRVEVRSLNHKFLEISLKAPSFLSQLEIAFRNMVRDTFARGKFDISVFLAGEAAPGIAIDRGLVEKTYSSFMQLQAGLGIPGEIDINSILGMHSLFISKEQDFDLALITEVFRDALFGLLQMRNREGETLAAELERLAGLLRVMCEKVRGSCEDMVRSANEKFGERIRTLLEGRDIDGSRILQEAAITAARLDVSEELARLDSHLAQFCATLSEGGVIGRKLDFILQECNREANTIASKSVDYDISKTTVEMKTVIEQLREQVQNIQ